MAEMMITFEFGGVPVELISDKDIRKAIAAGRLRADTIVQIHGTDRSVVTARADAVELLRGHLGIADPDPATDAEAAAEPRAEEPRFEDAAASAVRHQPEPQADIWHEERPEERLERSPEPDETELYTPAAPEAAQKGAKTLVFVLGGLALLFLAAIISSQGGRGPTSAGGNDSAYANTNMITDALEPAGPQEREIGPARTFYAARQVVLRSESTPRSSEMGRLARGEEIFGTVVMREGGDEEWVRIDTGSHRDNYIWRGNLTDAMPPTLTRTLDERRLVPGSTAVYAAPNLDSATLQTLTGNIWVTLAGELSSGWWELALNNGGVGYLPPEAFAMNEGRDVWIRNDCSYPIYLRMIYQSRHGQEDNDGLYWSIEPGELIHAMHNRSYIKAVSDDFYYHVTTPSGPWRQSRPLYFDYGNTRYPMERVNAIIDESGNYYLRFYCTN